MPARSSLATLMLTAQRESSEARMLPHGEKVACIMNERSKLLVEVDLLDCAHSAFLSGLLTITNEKLICYHSIWYLFPLEMGLFPKKILYRQIQSYISTVGVSSTTFNCLIRSQSLEAISFKNSESPTCEPEGWSIEPTC